MIIFAIDPGTVESGLCMFETTRLMIKCGIKPNAAILEAIKAADVDLLAIEMFSSFGMPVGKEVFETVLWIGRFKQAWREPDAVRLVYRRDVKLWLCNNTRAKDANIRQALIDKLGPQGTKKEPGPTYGIKSHGWAALAVAVTVAKS